MKAFPATTNKDIYRDMMGMDLRDYFAARAMQYFASDALFYGDDTDEEYILTAKLCYRYADAMMEARK
jgi:hypothetical protein